jgi:hypothetical protein
VPVLCRARLSRHVPVPTVDLLQEFALTRLASVPPPPIEGVPGARVLIYRPDPELLRVRSLSPQVNLGAPFP